MQSDLISLWLLYSDKQYIKGIYGENGIIYLEQLKIS